MPISFTPTDDGALAAALDGEIIKDDKTQAYQQT